MAGKFGRRRTASREFTDRIDPRKAFWIRLDKMLAENRSTFITYYGTGGIGKSALSGKLMDELDSRRAEFPNVVYLYHDFVNGGDYRMILNNWKNELKRHGCEFPFFETGDFVLSLKQGISRTELDTPQIESWIDKNQWMRLIRQKLQNEHPDVGSVRVLSTDFASRALALFPGVTTLSTLMNVISKSLSEIEIKRRLDDHAELRREMYRRAEERNPNVLNQLLPKLFAQDVCDWAGDEKKLIIFLDTYELLTGAIGDGDQLGADNLRRDWWIREDSEDQRGLLFELPPTLWVLGGRNKIRWTDISAAELDQHLIKALSKDDSEYFLQKAGILSRELRNRIYEVAGGYPLYLDLCVDIYEEYIAREQVPTADDFGRSREQIVERLMKYMNDDVRLTVQCLSLLGTWTNRIARQLVLNFDPNIYTNAKRFSFIQSQEVTVGEETLTVYRFDRTLQKILHDAIANDEDLEYLIDEILDSADEYFEQLLQSEENLQAAVFYLKIWSELIVRLVDDAERLKALFRNYIEVELDYLTDYGQFGAAIEILSLFLSSATIAREPNGLEHAFFDGAMGLVKNAAGEYSEALKYRRAAYEKFLSIFGEEHPGTIMAINNIAITLSELGRFDEALKLQEQVLELRKKVLGEEHHDTLGAMGNLAATLSALGRFDEAVTIEEQVLELSRKILGEKNLDTIKAMNNLAATLDLLGKFDDALKFQEQVLELRKDILGERHSDTIMAMNNLAWTLQDLGRLDEAFRLQQKTFELHKKFFGAEHPDTIKAMNNLAATLSELGRNEKALQLQQQVLDFRQKIFGEEHPDTISAMHNIAATLSAIGKNDEALKLQEQVLKLRQKVLGEEHPDTIMAMHNLAWTLRNLGRFEEALQLQQKVLVLYKKVFDPEHPNTLNAMNNLAATLSELGRNEKALLLQRQVLQLNKKNLGAEHPDTIMAMHNLAWTLRNLGRFEEALQLLQSASELCQKVFNSEYPLTINVPGSLAQTLKELGRNDDAARQLERMLAVAKKIYVDDEKMLNNIIEWHDSFFNDEGKIDESQSIEMESGQRLELPALKNIGVINRWNAEFEINAFLFMRRADDADCVDLDDGMCSIELSKVPEDIIKIDSVLAIDGNETFEQVSEIKLRLIDDDSGKQLIHFDCNEHFTREKAIVLGELYRREGNWKFQAIGAGFNGGLEALCRNFGVEIE